MVEPKGDLRFAVTARHIQIPLLAPEIQAAAQLAGTVPEHLQLPPYNGGLDVAGSDLMDADDN